jgi:nicotinamidase-related amidase
VFCLADRSDKVESLSSGERFSVVDEDAVHGLPVLRGDPYHREMTFDPKTLGLVLIEYQNDFTTEGGVLHDAVSAVMEKTRMLEHTRNVAAAARRAGATVMHAPIAFAEGYGEISDTPYGILKGVVDGGAFVKGSWGAAIVDDLAPVDGDIVIEGKRGLDTFASTNLDFILRSKGITTIALGGFLANCCVESTMRTGYESRYRVVTLTDCVAGTSVEEHDNAIKFDYPMFSQPMTAAEFINALTQ